MPTNDAALKQYYAARAREYERIYYKPERQADLKRIEEMLPPLFAGRRVLEIACGTGYWTQLIARTAKHVVAVDANHETLAVAAEKIWPQGRVSFEVADAYVLPDALGVFDAVFAGFWWSHIPVRERLRFFKAVNRRLQPGARALFLDNLYVAGSSTPISHSDDDGNTYQRRTLEDGSEYVVLKNFPDEQTLVANVAHCAREAHYTALDYYWLFRYAFHPGED